MKYWSYICFPLLATLLQARSPQMSPRCLPDASQMPPKCLPEYRRENEERRERREEREREKREERGEKSPPMRPRPFFKKIRCLGSYAGVMIFFIRIKTTTGKSREIPKLSLTVGVLEVFRG